MKKIISILILFAIPFMLNACSTWNRRIVTEGPNDHHHMRSNMKVIGDYHAQLLVAHKKGILTLNIYDDMEEPYKIKVDKLIAEMDLPDGESRQIVFTPNNTIDMDPKYRNRERRYGVSSSYTASADYLKNIHEFDLKFIIPIRQEAYQVTFDYGTSDKENSHHMHHYIN